jgi:hypothetical protein
MEQHSSYQIPYHNLDVPINPPPLSSEYSSLHTLYPGVPMRRNDYDYIDRYYIPHADPEAACRSFKDRREDTIRAARLVEDLARRSAGGPDEKTTIHAVADPSQVVEEPALQQLSTQNPIALNDGMSFPEKAVPSDSGDGPSHSGDTPSEVPMVKRENFKGIAESSSDDNIFVYLFICLGVVFLVALIMSAVIGMKKSRR